MIALIFALPSAGNALTFTDFNSTTAQVAPRTERRLSLVPSAPADGRQTVAQFCAARGIARTNSEMSRIGRRAAALSRAAGHLIGRAVEAFGEVNTYEPAVLAQAFAAIESTTC